MIVNTHAMDPQQLIEFFGSLSAEWALECLKVGTGPDASGALDMQLVPVCRYHQQTSC